ncbi:MAG: hypothetical protein AAGA25_05620 [Planctomycetota bacterium]
MMATPSLQPVLPGRPAYTPNNAWTPNRWCFRVAAVVLSLGVSGMYGILLTEHLAEYGMAILLGAGIAWFVLLSGVWFSSQSKWRFARMDWCLWTMAVGSIMMTIALLAATALPSLGFDPMPLLLGGLLLADLTMGWALISQAPKLEVKRVTAALTWIVGMNGFLLAFLGLTSVYPGVLYSLVIASMLALMFALLVSPVAAVIALAIYLGREDEPTKKDAL